MTEEGLTTEQHAQRIAESWLNGQRKQAKQQFLFALSEEVNNVVLLAYLREELGEENTLNFCTYLLTT
jgi:DNA polymerase III delta subunit